MNKILQLILLIGVDYAPTIIALVIDAVKAIEEAKDSFTSGQAKKSAALKLIESAFNSIGFFTGRLGDYKGQVMELADRLIDFAVAGFNLTGFWGVKLDLSQLPEEGTIDYTGGEG